MGNSPLTEASCRTLFSLVDNLDAMLAYWNENQVCVFANNAYRHWFGKSREEMIGITLQQLLGPLYEKNLPYLQAAYGGEKQVFERAIPDPQGKIRHSLATYIPHIDNGKVCGIFVHVTDVTPLKLHEQELEAARNHAEQLATHDFLTGLPNRVILMDRIMQTIASARRSKQMMALFTLDIDDFKLVNDAYGHTAGDRILIEIAARLQNTVRQSDTVIRIGGDEFLVLVPMADSREQIETLATRLLNNISQPCKLGDQELVSSFSIGVALYPDHGTTPEQLIASSDKAMYAAKRTGKNRFRFADAPDVT